MYAKFGGPKVESLVQYTKAEASKGTIDDPINMRDDKVYLFRYVCPIYCGCVALLQLWMLC